MAKGLVLHSSLSSMMSRRKGIIWAFMMVLLVSTSTSFKTKTHKTRGDFVRTKVARGLIHYSFQGMDDVSGAQQTVNVLKIDLDSDRYKVLFHYGSDSTSAVAEKFGAIAAINATFEPDATYIRVDGQNHSEVSIPAGHLRYWKHDGAIVGDGCQDIRIVNGASGEAATASGGEKAIELYKSLPDKNIFSGAPVLIDDYDPVGAGYVPDSLYATNFKGIKYEDYRRHQGIRHPRTAVALTADNDLLLIVVDGRNEAACGMNAKELTLFLAKHFNPRWALNMDGGGSATMVVKGMGAPETNVVNHPHDNHRFDHYGQRRICTHILVQSVK